MVASIFMFRLQTYLGILLGVVPVAVAQSAAERGGPVFLQQCGFCHGRDAAGGEDGPDLTRSKLVATDVGGNQIAPVIRFWPEALFPTPSKLDPPPLILAYCSPGSTPPSQLAPQSCDDTLTAPGVRNTSC